MKQPFGAVKLTPFKAGKRSNFFATLSMTSDMANSYTMLSARHPSRLAPLAPQGDALLPQRHPEVRVF